MRVDPTGALDGSPDEYVFNEKGNYVRTDAKPGEHKLIIENSNTGNRQTYNFADPVNDPKAIDKGDINRVEFVSKGQIANILKNGGAFSQANRNNKVEYIANESSNTENSTGAGKFDFSYNGIPINVKGASLDPERTRSLFIPVGDNYVHNHQNLGNFLWGAGGYSLGFNKLELSGMAHANSLLNPSLNGYPSQLDSADDQLSISRGASYAKKYDFRNIKFK